MLLHRKPKGARTDKLKNVATGCFEIAQVGVEYQGPKQNGGIYGIVYRQYFTTSLPADLTTGNNVSRIVDFTVIGHDGTDRYTARGLLGDGTDALGIRLDGTSGNSNATLITLGLFTGNVQFGWIDYTK